MTWPMSLLAGNCDSKDLENADSEGHKAEVKSRPQSVPSPKELLRHYAAPGVPLPPSARVGDPKLKQREREPFRLSSLWRYGAFAAWKASDLVAAVVSHQLRGPPKKSWGIEMTILTCIMRDVSRHSHLADITMIRLLMGLSGLVPVPSDALVTPVTFHVRQRGLRGILSEFDAAEDGSRELSGEWVVGKRTWQRLQAERRAARREAQHPGSSSPNATPSHPKRRERVVLYLHGGAYYTSSPATHRLITIPLSKSLDARLFAIDYRLAPETKFPGPLHDAVSAYFRLVYDLQIPHKDIIVAGDSAGGGLTLALMMYLRDNGYPLPGGGILMSPWVDLTMSCDSWESNAQYDVVPPPLPGDHLNPIACYLGEHMEKYLTHPYASPLFGDFEGLPPLLIQAGDSEVLRDEITLLAHKATLAGVIVEHELYEDAVHVFQTFPFLDQARQAFYSARKFVRQVLDPLDSDAPPVLQDKTEDQLEEEIDNAAVQIVQGDGSQSTSKLEEIEHARSTRTGTPTSWMCETKESSDLEEGSSSTDEDPSWVSPAPWPSPPPSPEVVPENPATPRRGLSRSTSARNSASICSTASSRSVGSTRSRATSLTSSSFWSPLSSLSTLSTDSSRSTSTTTGSLHHSHSRSHISMPGSNNSTHPPTNEHRMPAASLTPSASAVPRPSIRRSHSSYSDVATLCDEWAHHGPANRTLTYKPDTLPRRRKHSSSVSSVSSMLARPNLRS